MANAACVRKVLQRKGPQTALMQVYGPTECTTYSTLYELTEQDAGRDIMPIGRPLANDTTYVLDDNRRLVPVGVPGELYIGGDGVAIGYLNRPELTAERFVENPFATPEDHERGANLVLYKTGDRVRWLADGTLHILGRIDFQVKVRGFRIEPEEVEKALLTHPGVRQCIVVPWEGNLIAYWVPSGPPGAVSQGDLKSHLMTQLPDYMVPTAFLETERFELNRNGKIDRTKLLSPGIALVMAKKGEQVAPRTETERRLVAIWQDLLRIGSVGVQDSFFELGGNSILTVRMLALVKQAFGAEINVASLFSRPTIAAIAARIDRSGPAEVVGEDNLALALQDAQEDLPVTAGTQPVPGRDPQGLLLTGVTGFLGFHLLEKLLSLTNARIYCLVRGLDDDAVTARFVDTLRFYGHPELAGHPRIVLVRGDLGKPDLGLEPRLLQEFDERVDHIMHCGAFVHHMFDYRTVRDENVGSVVELLKIAAQGRPKVFHFISTLSVASRRDHEGRIVEVEIGDRPISTNGYVMSKWAAERILQHHTQKGLRVNIFRPGNITGHSLTGVCAPEKNHALLLVKGCLQMGCAPDWKRPIEMTPVDLLAEAIVRLSLDSPGGGVFNMNNPVQMDWADYMAVLGTFGLACDLVSFDVWRQRLEGIGETNALYPLREIYLKAREDLIDPEGHALAARDSSMTQDALHRLGVFYPCDYLPHLRTLVHYLQTSGFFPTATQ
jgi:thioester reductase-like protein